MGKFGKFLHAYNQFLLNYPLLGNSVTGAAGMAVGNIVCQAIMFGQEKTLDPFKLLQFTLFGLFIAGPLVGYWWTYLDTSLFKDPKTWLRPLRMTLVDQTISPWVMNGLFIYYLAVTGGGSHQEAIQDLNNNLVKITLESYKIWPMAMLINFYMIPAHNRVIFSNVVGVLWNTYLTFITSARAN